MNAGEERVHALRGRAETWRAEGMIDDTAARAVAAELATGWRSYGLLPQIVFFAMAAVAILAAYALLSLLEVPARGVIIAVICLVTAEYLIRRRRWWRTGVEAALWIGATFALVSALPRNATPESLLVLAAASAIPAARLRNPLFAAIAAMFVVVWSESRFDAGVVVALLIASVAVAALTRTWRRPSTEWSWIALAVLVPVAGLSAADPEWRLVTIALYLFFGAGSLVLAIRVRHHALFAAAAIGLTVAVVESVRAANVPLEVALGAGGAALMLIGWGSARALRGRTRGIVATPAKLTPYDDDLHVAGSVATCGSTGEQPDDARPQGDGRFGGAGATGEF